MEKIIAGLVQMDSGPDMNENMRMAEQYVREAAEQGAKLILFPETAEYTGADMPGHASAVPGYVSRRFSSLAKRYGVYLHCGSMTVRRHPGRPSNTSFLFGPDGETIAEYSKIHMFDVNIPGSVSYEESHEICPGNEIVLADTALGLFGMSICYDIRFPEQVTARCAAPEDLEEIQEYLSEYCADFGYSVDELLSAPFTVITPDSKNPYKQMYVAN